MNLKNIFSKIKKIIILPFVEFAVDFLCPRRCIVCNGFSDMMSGICMCRKCKSIAEKSGSVYVDDRTAWEEVISALEYDGHTRDAMMRYKFNGKRYFHRTFAYAVYQKISGRSFLSDIDVICPVPVHPLRLRDYNQSALIAHDISEWTGIGCTEDLLLKVKHIKPLSTMSYRERRIFVRDSMIFNMRHDILGKNILLVDDIFTSGATVAECSRILRIYGAAKVYAVSACYTKREKSEVR